MKTEHGNVLLIVFLGIILFGALNFTILRTTEEDVVSDQNAYMRANELIQYGESLREGAAYVRTVNGCAIEQISFEPPPFSDTGSYYNANSPTDYRCHIHHQDGAGVDYKTDHFANLPGFQGINISAGTDMEGVGVWDCADTTCTEVYLFMSAERSGFRAICEAYNRILKHNDLIPPPSTTYVLSSPFFNGTFTSTHNGWVNPYLSFKKHYCYNYGSDTTRDFFIYTLIER